MKRSKKRLTFATAVAGAALAAALTACHETVYGPPETVYGPPAGETTTDPAEEIPETVYGPPAEEYGDTADPAEEVPETVYGPPADDFGETYDPAEEIPQDVYGPPVPMGILDSMEDVEDIEEEEPEENAGAGSSSVLSARPEGPRPIDNVPAALYGPPPAE